MTQRPPLSYLKLSAGLSVFALLSACATSSSDTAQHASHDELRDAIGVYSSTDATEGLDPVAAAAFWGTRYNTDQSDPNIAVKFSQALRKIKSTDEAFEVMRKANAISPDNAAVSLEFGKVLVQSGRAFEAVRHIETAAAENPSDWNALSAYGVALDQIGEHEEARKKYDRALNFAPGNVSIINNKGLSFALSGDLNLAEVTLRQAAGRAGGDARVRQNLALVLAIAGDMKGAERLARSDLPPAVADNNIDYYRQLMAQPAYWDEYANTQADVPAFDDTPAAPLKAPAPMPKLEEQPKPEPTPEENEPIALIGAAPVTQTSLTEPEAEKPSVEN